jgi:hypothetical protein
MLRDFLFYLLGIVAMVGGGLLLERIVAGPHSTAGTGYARVDSAFDFDRLRRKQYVLMSSPVRPRASHSSRLGAVPAPRHKVLHPTEPKCPQSRSASGTTNGRLLLRVNRDWAPHRSGPARRPRRAAWCWFVGRRGSGW